jgi:hypothetical protein
MFRAVAWSEYVGSTVFALAWSLPIVFAIFGMVSWLPAIAFAVGALASATWAWPYITIFEG